MIRLFLAGEINAAGEMLFINNPLSLICSLVCDHERQCEGNCILNKKGMPIHISTIENYISDNYLEKSIHEKMPKNGRRIGIIGAGPAGLTIAMILALRGYDITVFEGKEKIGGVLRYGIPDFRLPKTILDRFEKLLVSMNIKIRPNTSIGTVITVEDLIRDGYDALFIGTGIWNPKPLGIKGETLGNVHFAINYLTNPDVYHLGKNVIVIGTGNAAIDVARTVLRKGAQHVTLFSRSDSIKASTKEFEYAVIDGVKFEYNKAPVEITEKGLFALDTAVDAVSNHNDATPAVIEFYPADSVIISIGQGPRNRIASTTTGLEILHTGLLVTNELGATTRDGIFASGDVVLGAKTVVEAVAYSKSVAASIDRYVENRYKDSNYADARRGYSSLE